MVEFLEDLNESMAKTTDVLFNISKENSQRHDEIVKSLNAIHTLLTTHKDETSKTNLSDQPVRPSVNP